MMTENLLKNLYKAHTLSNRLPSDSLVKYKNIEGLLKARAENQPEDEYICYYDSDEKLKSYTYKEFYINVIHLSNYLMKNGIHPGNKVATYSYNHVDTIILYFACWVVGAVVVPININEDKERVEFILENSKAKIIFTRNEYYVSMHMLVGKKKIKIINFDSNSYHELPDKLKKNFNISLDDESMIVYTSGTTGNPKGVVLTQYNLLVDADSISKWHKLEKGDAMMCVLPIHHVNGTIVTMVTPMYYGGRTVLNKKFHTETFLKLLDKENVKVVSVVPTLLQYLLHSEEKIENYNLENFSHLICGAGPLTCELAKRFEEKFGLRIAHGYGLSETTCYSCFVPVDLEKNEHIKWQNKYGYPSIGIPIECNEMEIQDAEGKPLGENEKGEIVIRGHNVMKYYFNNDEANEKTFENGWFKSGDEGFYTTDENGFKYFFITGRIKELIIRGGVNISTLEIDEVIASNEYVESGIAVGFENDWYGEEVGALVHLKNGYAKDDEEIKKMLLQFYKVKLPFFKSPKVIIITDDIPVTSTGKYQRNKVKHLFEEYKTAQFKEY
jgi:long-chain acyl-CoA synthetase